MIVTFIICAGVTVILAYGDLKIKRYIEETFSETEERQTGIGKLVLRKVYNQGFALNLGESHPEAVQRLSVYAAIGIGVSAIRYFVRSGRKAAKAGSILLTAGTISNLYDRLIRGKVVDYLGLRVKEPFWEKLTFNLADVFIVAGMSLVTVSRMFYKIKRKKKD